MRTEEAGSPDVDSSKEDDDEDSDEDKDVSDDGAAKHDQDSTDGDVRDMKMQRLETDSEKTSEIVEPQTLVRKKRAVSTVLLSLLVLLSDLNYGTYFISH